MNDVSELNHKLGKKTPQAVLTWVLGHFGEDKISLASSLGAEDQVLTDMLLKISPRAVIFTLDTGRLPQETLGCLSQTEKKYGFKYRIYYPDKVAVEKMVADKGQDLFYENVENRKLCCHVRKVEPLKRALEGLSSWICGLRREQSVTRADLQVVEWDTANGLYKINPLIDWAESQIWDYIRVNQVPYNKLHDQGYPSIGCAPCTRAVGPGEGTRAGRWWWESADKKECGLHVKDGKAVRKSS